MRGQCVVHGATLHGVAAVPVSVEVVVSNGLPGFSVVGMPDLAIREACERIKAALRSCGFVMPPDKVLVNLAPCSMPKSGSGFDLPIAAGLLAATGQIDPSVIKDLLLVGELSLEGEVRPVAGLLAYASAAKDMGLGLLCGPARNQLVAMDGLRQFCIHSLSELREGAWKQVVFSSVDVDALPIDYADVAGHELAKRALQVAAAGNHGVLMMGPPGSGKSMLAKRLPSILPPLSREQSMESAVIHSIAGEKTDQLLAGVRPFRSPHHSATLVGLIGGGKPVRPGEVSLAHNGVLFLDELPEFRPSVLQSIRQPLESGEVLVTRANGTTSFPARFALVAASNPCPCGYYGDKEHACICTVPQVRNYQGRIGGPILDRIDIRIDVQRIEPSMVLQAGQGTSSHDLREGVLLAREYASWRQAQAGSLEYRLLKPAELVEACGLSSGDKAFFEKAAKRFEMSGRSIVRTLNVARTIADMEQAPDVNRGHICEALTMRIQELVL